MKKEKILLGLLPFWSPLIPPLGIACLKSFMQPFGYRVRCIDANTEFSLRKTYNSYFEQLEKFVPEDKKGNFYNIGSDVLQKHMMAYINRQEEQAYQKLVKILIAQTFYIQIKDSQVMELNSQIAAFFGRLEEYWLSLIDLEKPDILGLSVYSGTLPASLFVFKITREKYPAVKTVMGGGIFTEDLVPGSPNLDQILEKIPYIDYFIIGEGELLFLKLLRGEIPETSRVLTLKKFGGDILDLASVSIPDFSDFNIINYPNLAAYTSRGCPFQCNFCAETVNWGKYRKKRGVQIHSELVQLYKKYGFQLFLMCDSLLNPIITELSEAFIDSELSLYWDGYLRADEAVCQDENTLLWRRGGFYRARLGVESGSPRILESMGKKITVEQIKRAVRSLAGAGIKTTTYWVIGYPGETEEDFCMTLKLIEELKDEIYEADCNPFIFNFTGQVASDRWIEKYNRVSLYPEEAVDMLLVQTWMLDCEPPRPETFNRLSRFVEHCKKLGVPNPYTLYDICRADERWKNLHSRSVPSLLDLNNTDNYINESKHIDEFHLAQATPDDGEDFGF